jgi:hypothetical protein
MFNKILKRNQSREHSAEDKHLKCSPSEAINAESENLALA